MDAKPRSEKLPRRLKRAFPFPWASEICETLQLVNSPPIKTFDSWWFLWFSRPLCLYRSVYYSGKDFVGEITWLEGKRYRGQYSVKHKSDFFALINLLVRGRCFFWDRTEKFSQDCFKTGSDGRGKKSMLNVETIQDGFICCLLLSEY